MELGVARKTKDGFGTRSYLVTVTVYVHHSWSRGRKERFPSPPRGLVSLLRTYGIGSRRKYPSSKCITRKPPFTLSSPIPDSFKRLSPVFLSTDLLATFSEVSHPPTTIAIMVGPLCTLLRFAILLLGLSFLVTVEAQSSSSSSTPSPNLSLSISTATSVSNVVSGSRTIQVTSVYPVTYTYPLSSPTTGTPTPTAPPTETSSPAPIRLSTDLDPGFGVLGALLILTGIPSAFLGHKNRWYTLELFNHPCDRLCTDTVYSRVTGLPSS